MNDSDLDDTLQLENLEESDGDISEGQSEQLTDERISSKIIYKNYSLPFHTKIVTNEENEYNFYLEMS